MTVTSRRPLAAALTIAVVGALLALAPAGPAHAVPGNDASASATALTGTPPITDSIDVIGATTEASEPTPTCIERGNPGATFDGSIWYTFTPASSNDVVTLAGSDDGANIVLAVYRQDGSGFGGLVEVECNAAQGYTVREFAGWPATAGTQYSVQVAIRWAAFGTAEVERGDTLFGGSGNDVVRGGNGNDTIKGQGDDDTLRGNGGTDSLEGNAGIDLADGGPGADTCSAETLIAC
ncbi:hypothetical protein HQ535_05105 [bacterium]|nr:hypothetical protein [bacterium]